MVMISSQRFKAATTSVKSAERARSQQRALMPFPKGVLMSCSKLWTILIWVIGEGEINGGEEVWVNLGE